MNLNLLVVSLLVISAAGTAGGTLAAPQYEDGDSAAVVSGATDPELAVELGELLTTRTSDPTATFSNSFYQEQTGDTTSFSITMQGTTEVDLTFGGDDSGYQAIVRAVDGDGDGVVDVTFDTYLAGDGSTSSTFGVSASGDSLSVLQAEDTLSDPLEPFSYRLAVAPAGGAESDVATLVLEGRTTGDLAIRSVPASASIDDIEAVEQFDNGVDEVAIGDEFVVVLNATGLEFLLDHVTAADLEDGAAYADATGAEIRIEESVTAANSEAGTLEVGQGSLFADPSNDVYYIQYSTMDFPSLEDGDVYDVTFNVSELFPYAQSEAEANAQTVTAQVTFAEQAVAFDTFDGGLDRIIVEASPNYLLSGTTTLAPDTELSLTARSTGGAPFLYQETLTVSDTRSFSTPLDFSELTPESRFEITVDGFETRAAGLAPDGYALYVDVSDASGESVDDATIRVDGETFVSGSALENGTYTVEATAPDRPTATEQVTIAGSDARVNLVLDDSLVELTVLVLDESGAPLSDAQVTVGSNSLQAGETARLETGTYTIQASSAGLESVTRDVVVQETSQTVEIALSESLGQTATSAEQEDTTVVPDSGQPGFGVGVSLIALLGAALLAARRER